MRPTTTETDRIVAWVLRVADSVSRLRNTESMTYAERLEAIRTGYTVLMVMTMVARGEAHIRGVPAQATA